MDSAYYRALRELANPQLKMDMPDYLGPGDAPGLLGETGNMYMDGISGGTAQPGGTARPAAGGASPLGSNPVSIANNLYKGYEKIFGAPAIAGTGTISTASVPAVVTSLANTGLGAGALGTGLTLGTAGAGLTAGASGLGLAGTGLGAGAGSGIVAGAGGLAGGGLSTASVGTATGLANTGLGAGAASTGATGGLASIGALGPLAVAAGLVAFGMNRSARKKAERQAKWEAENPGKDYLHWVRTVEVPAQLAKINAERLEKQQAGYKWEPMRGGGHWYKPGDGGTEMGGGA